MHSEFPLAENIIHLNHAGIAPWPKRTVEAVIRFAHENMTLGSRNYRRWMEIEDSLREQARRLINAGSAAEIALLKSTSEGLSVVAYGVDWQPGDNVVTSRQEFPSNRIVWESLHERYGVEVRLADLNRVAIPEDALLELVDNNTRLLAISSVQFANGLRMDLKRLGTLCRTRNIMFCIDAIQSLGAEPFDAQAVNADFVVADGHKWMLGPEAVAIFYCHPRHYQSLKLNQFGWHMVADHYNYERMDWSAAPNARRFECGSPNTLGIHALHASLSLLLDTGLDTIHRKLVRNIDYLYELLGQLDLECLTPRPHQRRAGIITFRHPEKNNRLIYKRLQEHGVLCAQRAGGIRLSPHFYTPQNKLERTAEILKYILSSL